MVLGEDWPPRFEAEKGWRDRLREAVAGDSASADSTGADSVPGGARGDGG